MFSRNDINVLIDEETIKIKIKELAKKISEDYSGKEPVIIGVLKGATIFLSDLIRQLDIDCNVDFISVSSYGNATATSGVVKILKDVDMELVGKDVLIVEDIVDSGLTLNYLKSYIKNKAASSIKTCVLLDKPARRQVDFKTDYSGFEIEDLFIVGYGLDYQQKFRNLPYIGFINV